MVDEAVKHCHRIALLCPNFPEDQSKLPTEEVLDLIFFELLHAAKCTKSKNKISGWRIFFGQTPQGEVAWLRIRAGVLAEASSMAKSAKAPRMALRRRLRTSSQEIWIEKG